MFFFLCKWRVLFSISTTIVSLTGFNFAANVGHSVCLFLSTVLSLFTQLISVFKLFNYFGKHTFYHTYISCAALTLKEALGRREACQIQWLGVLRKSSGIHPSYYHIPKYDSAEVPGDKRDSNSQIQLQIQSPKHRHWQCRCLLPNYQSVLLKHPQQVTHNDCTVLDLMKLRSQETFRSSV